MLKKIGFYMIWNMISSLAITCMILGIIKKEISFEMYAFLFILISAFFIFMFEIIDFIRDWYKINGDNQ